MKVYTLDFSKIKDTRDELAESLKKWKLPDSDFYGSSISNQRFNRPPRPSFTNTGIVLQAFNEHDRCTAQVIAEKLLSYLEQRELNGMPVLFPPETVGDDEYHVMSNSWATFALLDCFPTRLDKPETICNWFLENQRIEDGGWDFIPGIKTNYPSVSAYALRTLVKCYSSIKSVTANNPIIDQKFSRAIILGVDGLLRHRFPYAKNEGLYLWTAATEGEESRRISFGTSTLCMHIIAKAAKTLKRNDWDANIINTLSLICGAFEKKQDGKIRILDYEIDIWDSIHINERGLNYPWHFFAPVSLTTLIMHADQLKDTPGYLGMICDLTSWIIEKTQRVNGNLGVRGGEYLPGVKIWSTAQSVIGLSHLLDNSYKIREIYSQNSISSESYNQNSVSIESLSHIINYHHEPRPSQNLFLYVAGSIFIYSIFDLVFTAWSWLEPLIWLIAVVCFLLGVDFKGSKERIVRYKNEIITSKKIVNEIKGIITQRQIENGEQRQSENK